MARKSYSSEFKFSIVLEALKERKTLQEIASEQGIAPSQISRWVDEFKSSGAEVFSKDNKSSKRIELLETELYAKVGKLTTSHDWLKKTGEAGRLVADPVVLVEENLYFSISEHCKWYEISRNSYYYTPKPKKISHLNLRDQIKNKYTKDPSSGSRRITAALNRDGILVKRAVVRYLMKDMRIKGIMP